jgi:hypothetical protein
MPDHVDRSREQPWAPATAGRCPTNSSFVFIDLALRRVDPRADFGCGTHRVACVPRPDSRPTSTPATYSLAESNVVLNHGER